MKDHLWDFFVQLMQKTFMPLVLAYFTVTSSVFFNVSAENAKGLEKAANTLLMPAQYIMAGKVAIQTSDGTWKLVQRFEYSHYFWLKTCASAIALPPSLTLGTTLKALAFLSKTTRERHKSIVRSIKSTEIHSNLALYKTIGLNITPSSEVLTSLGKTRKPGDENVLAIEKKGLQEITSLLNVANIPWWVDCGTCLGAYRYGGAIPWDADIDIAVLLNDFENVQHVLNKLDRKKYIVQDWSSREHPNSYIKVYMKESGTLIDIYHFAIDATAKNLHYILSLENNVFFPEWWKIRERRYKVPVAFDTVFPLKRANFDGVEVFVPNDTVKYLQRYYGENLEPVKIYDPITQRYEKDLSHPYWNRTYAH